MLPELHDGHAEAHAAHCKSVATLQARAALAGFELVALADGGFLVTKWGLLKTLADLDAAAAFLDQAGANHHG